MSDDDDDDDNHYMANKSFRKIFIYLHIVCRMTGMAADGKDCRAVQCSQYHRALDLRIAIMMVMMMMIMMTSLA